MDPLSNLPGITYFTQMIKPNLTYKETMDLIAPLALKALNESAIHYPIQRKDINLTKNTIKMLQGDPISKQTIPLDYCLNFDKYLSEVWISCIQEKTKNLPPDVIEKLSESLNTFLTSNEEEKEKLALSFVRLVQENTIDAFEISKKVFTDQALLLEEFKLKIKGTIISSIQDDLANELGKWAEEIEKKRVAICFKPHNIYLLSSQTELDKEKAKEICLVESRYFYPIQSINQQILSNNFYLSFYENTSELFWEEEIQTLTESNKKCYQVKSDLKKEKATELSNIDQRYEILKQEALKKQGKLQKQDQKHEEALKKQITSLSNDSLDKISQLVKAFALTPENKKICAIM